MNLSLNPWGRWIAGFVCFVLFSACDSQRKPGRRVPEVRDIITAEALAAVLGAPGVCTTPKSQEQYMNPLDFSTLSSADFQTAQAPTRLLRARLIHKPKGVEEGKLEFFYQKDDIMMVRTAKPVEGVKAGDEAVAVEAEEGRNIRLVVRIGDKVVNLHASGNGGPVDQLAALIELAEFILSEAEKAVPTNGHS